MILFFGPSGAGKSVQGQKLANSQGWKWLSAGKLLRDEHDETLLQEMSEGELVNSARVNEIVSAALNKLVNSDNVILDGFPRQIEQAVWLLEDCKNNNRSVDLVVVLDVPKEELIKRLQLRGRADDTLEAINERLRLYDEEILPILDYLIENNIKVVHVDGMKNIDQVHDEIVEELKLCQLI